MTAYYNEKDPYAAQWLRNLIAAGHIAPGDVDERSIVDVRADDLAGYQQCHFFAGIGIWSAALRQAGWEDTRPVWTGSCPCQPLSSAGKGMGTRDARHLWPNWFKLIRDRRPITILGEQVASPDGLAWLDIVCADLENEGYPVWPIDLCAAGFGAPNIRQRIWFLAYPDEGQRGRLPTSEERQRDGAPAGWIEGHGEPQPSRTVGELGNAAEPRSLPGAHPGVHRSEEGPGPRDAELERSSATSRLADAEGPDQRRHGGQPRDETDPCGGEARAQDGNPFGGSSAVGPTNGFWAGCDWLPCTDGKARPVESGTFPLAYVDPQRVGRLRAYGNGLNQEAAAGFISAAKEEIAAFARR